MKRIMSLVLITSMILSSFTMASAAEAISMDSVDYPDQINVVYSNEDGYMLESNKSSRANDMDISTFIHDEHEFYKPESNNELPQNFRLVLQDDNTLLPVYEVEVDLDSLDSYHELIDIWGYDENTEMMKTIYSLIEDHDENISSVTAYVTPCKTSDDTPTSRVVVPDNYTKVVNGKTVKTVYLRIDGVSGSGGQTIARPGRDGITNADQLEKVTVSLSQSRSLGLTATVLKLFGSIVFNKFKSDWMDPKVTTNPYINEVLNYSNVIRYTNVIEGGVEYSGCISNRVYANCTLVHYATGAGYSPQIVSGNEISGTFTSSKYSNSAAEQAAVKNYLSGPLLDRIETIYVHVEYPTKTRKFAESIKY